MRKQLAIVLTTVIILSAAARCDSHHRSGGRCSHRRTAGAVAQTNLAMRAISDTTLSEAAALLEGACKLNPTDQRYPHLRADACLALHDNDGALEALNQCAALDGADQVAQVQIIDLYAAKRQSADAQIKYFHELLAADKIADEVKSHASMRLVHVLLDRGQGTEAKDELEHALKLNPLNADALELKEQLTRTGPVREHVAALLALLRNNPAQPAVDARLADDLAVEGLTNEAAAWYSNSISVGSRLNLSTDPQTFLNYVSELLIGGQIKSLDTALNSLLDKEPTNSQGLYLNMLLARRGTDKDAITKAVDMARDGFLERLYSAYRLVAKVDPPTTRPTGELVERTGDVVAQAKQIKQSGNQKVIAQYAEALTDLATLEIYFAQTPVPAKPLIDALHELIEADDVRFARLEGWALLVAGKPDEAKVKLSAVADHDPLSAMGLIQIAAKDPKQKDDAKASAQTLLNDNRAGLLGAILVDGLRDQGATVEVSSDGNDIKADLDKFPKAWFTFVDNPDNFYVISCSPQQVSHQFDEPILAVVRIINVGAFDISIGTKGGAQARSLVRCRDSRPTSSAKPDGRCVRSA